MRQLTGVVSDRGSRYAVSGGPAADRAAVDRWLELLRRDRKFARATHHSWALILSDGSQHRGDDGEAGAGAVILRMLEREGLRDHVVIVTRWYGGKHLGGDRFRHIQDCVRAYLQDIAP